MCASKWGLFKTWRILKDLDHRFQSLSWPLNNPPIPATSPGSLVLWPAGSRLAWNHPCYWPRELAGSQPTPACCGTWTPVAPAHHNCPGSHSATHRRPPMATARSNGPYENALVKKVLKVCWRSLVGMQKMLELLSDLRPVGQSRAQQLLTVDAKTFRSLLGFHKSPMMNKKTFFES